MTLIDINPHDLMSINTTEQILNLEIGWPKSDGVACHERHPGDARVKVGSEQEFASLPQAANFQCREILGFRTLVCLRAPSKIAAASGE